MKQYKLYVYIPNESNPPILHDYEGIDDASAWRRAKTVGDSRTVEIWESGRLVGRIGQDGLAIGTGNK